MAILNYKIQGSGFHIGQYTRAALKGGICYVRVLCACFEEVSEFTNPLKAVNHLLTPESWEKKEAPTVHKDGNKLKR